MSSSPSRWTAATVEQQAQAVGEITSRVHEQRDDADQD